MMQRRQVPRGDENLVCPLHKATMDTVCHKCPWWIQISGADPQNGEMFDQWHCAISWLPKLTIDVARQAHSGAAATEDFRNRMLALNGQPEPPRRLADGQTRLSGAERLLSAGQG